MLWSRRRFLQDPKIAYELGVGYAPSVLAVVLVPERGGSPF